MSACPGIFIVPHSCATQGPEHPPDVVFVAGALTADISNLNLLTGKSIFQRNLRHPISASQLSSIWEEQTSGAQSRQNWENMFWEHVFSSLRKHRLRKHECHPSPHLPKMSWWSTFGNEAMNFLPPTSRAFFSTQRETQPLGWSRGPGIECRHHR